ncbi:hypothetical protein Mal35_16730 [Gimesia maris]|uniref:hypothetical protein n=1 Tax=Gimesia maris TaxID=122 RepID=UPI0011884B86|nr:hypothetical protein [Gimesia maris]QDT78241.1 hypothetical protein Mal35_16730 [Gimesia maris]
MNELIKPPPFSRPEVIRRATELFRGYADFVGNDTAMLGINFDLIFKKYIYPVYEIDLIEDHDLGVDDDGEKILGYFQPQFNRVFIDPSLREDPRRVFTCWHEVGGHAILQGDWLRQEMKRIGMVREIATTAPMMSPDVEDTLERQANLFAAHAAAPIGFVNYRIKKAFDLTQPYRYTGPGRYCFSLSSGTRYREVADFEYLCNCIAYYIKHWFGGLSVEALSYRVAESKWVVDTTHQVVNPLTEFGLKRSSRGSKRRRTKNNATNIGELLTAVR